MGFVSGRNAMETQPTHLPTFARDPITPSSAVPHWQERCKEERVVTFDVVTDKTVVYRKKVTQVLSFCFFLIAITFLRLCM